jgi:hypothetical protein
MPYAVGPCWAVFEHLQDELKTVFSLVSLAITAYFWLVRANREWAGMRFQQVGLYEGQMEDSGVAYWRGKLFVSNRSSLPNAVIEGGVELLWKGKWRSGRVATPEGSELPWNLEPLQVVPYEVLAIFDLGKDTTREEVYEDHRLRFTFLTVEGRRFVTEVRTNVFPTTLATPVGTKRAA